NAVGVERLLDAGRADLETTGGLEVEIDLERIRRDIDDAKPVRSEPVIGMARADRVATGNEARDARSPVLVRDEALVALASAIEVPRLVRRRDERVRDRAARPRLEHRDVDRAASWKEDLDLALLA